MSNSYYCVILAGGIGSRFWPYSRKHYPKQFLDFFGTGESLLQMTVKRFEKILPLERILVSTNEAYRTIVEEQIPLLPKENILCEPCSRNTAAAIAYASMHIHAIEPQATIVIAPSDHLVLKEEAFERSVLKCLANAQEGGGLVTMGIRPTHPETGYGYIQVQNDEETELEPSTFYTVKTFTEKPSKHMAKILVDSGEFFWNSGLFFATTQTMIDSISTHLPELAERLFSQREAYGTPAERSFITEVFPYCSNISFDYGVMEKTDNVRMLLCDFGWADLGSWGAIHSVSAKDKDQNVVLGSQQHILNDSEHNLVVVDDPQQLVVLQGMSDTIVVKKENVLLVCRRGEEQKLKQVLIEASAIDEDFVN